MFRISSFAVRGFVEQRKRKIRDELFFQLYVCVCLCVVCITLILLILVRECVAISRRARIANLVGEDSRCRGGIVLIRCGCSGMLLERPNSPTALWRFRVSTSNSPSGQTRLHANTHMRYIDHTYAQQGIRVRGDDPLEPPKRQLANSKALWLLHVSII